MAEKIVTTQETIRQELEATRAAYHQLLLEIPDDAWELPTSNPKWNVRQVAYHIIIAVRFLPQDLKMLRHGRMVTPPEKLFNTLNDWYTRWSARNHNRRMLAAAYDKEHARILKILDTIREDEWQISAIYPDINENLSGKQSIADMFHYLTVHYWEHQAEIREAMGKQE